MLAKITSGASLDVFKSGGQDIPDFHQSITSK